MPYTAEVTDTLQKALYEILDEARVTQEVAKWLADQGITKLEAFADLADSKAEIVQIVGRGAGLDIDNAIKCQPLKTAWRQAEAQVKGQTASQASGQQPEPSFTMTPEARHNLGNAVVKHFNFRWPTSIIPSSGLISKINAIYTRKLQETPRIQEARSLLDKGGADDEGHAHLQGKRTRRHGDDRC